MAGKSSSYSYNTRFFLGFIAVLFQPLEILLIVPIFDFLFGCLIIDELICSFNKIDRLIIRSLSGKKCIIPDTSETLKLSTYTETLLKMNEIGNKPTKNKNQERPNSSS